jgi:hypothetical protein
MEFYTENRLMYFEVVECETLFGKGKFKIDAYNKLGFKYYSYEREITEGMVFNSEKEANIIAEHLAHAYDWGYDDHRKGK